VRRLFALIAALIVTLSLLIVGVRVIGAKNPSPVIAMLDPGDCALPCWHSIQPGKTTFHEAKEILNADRYQISARFRDEYYLEWSFKKDDAWRGFFSGKGNAAIYDIRLQSAKRDVSLGDIVTVFQAPVAIRYCWFARSTYLYFRDNIVVQVHADRREYRFDPQMSVNEITYLHPAVQMGNWAMEPWRGFTVSAARDC